jgi:hypothetical protein
MSQNISRFFFCHTRHPSNFFRQVRKLLEPVNCTKLRRRRRGRAHLVSEELLLKAVRDMTTVSMRSEGDSPIYKERTIRSLRTAHPFFVIAITGVSETIPAKRVEEGRSLVVVGLVTPYGMQGGAGLGEVSWVRLVPWRHASAWHASAWHAPALSCFVLM